MIISELEYLEAVNEENRIEGGLQIVAGSTQSVIGFANTGRLSFIGDSVGSASQTPVTFGSTVIGTLNEIVASSFYSISTFPF